MIPVLETPRLVLRGHAVDDLDDSAAMWADPIVVRHVGGRPATREETWARLLRYVGHWQLIGYGYWAVVERASGRFVGEVGFAYGRRDGLAMLDGVPEVGWALAPWAHGRGYATEAVLAAHAWLDGRRGRVRTACIIEPANTASIRVAERNGYRALPPATYRGEPTLVFERPVTPIA